MCAASETEETTLADFGRW